MSTGEETSPDGPSLPPVRIVDLGVLGYSQAYERQIAAVEARQRGEIDDTIFFVEHPHVITLGRSRAAEANVLAAGDVEVIAVERGGDVTYHGPGQLVAYPIIQLREGEQDLHAFLRKLEEAMILTLAEFGLAAGREDGKTGVWLGEVGSRRKIASIGIACRRWVTFHGLALNVSTDLSYFSRINPCGFDAAIMTSVAKELGREVAVGEVRDRLSTQLATTLSRRAIAASAGT